MEIESINQKLKQSEIANELGCSSSTLKRYWNDIYMLSPHRNLQLSTKENKNFQISNMSPKEPKWAQMIP